MGAIIDSTEEEGVIEDVVGCTDASSMVIAVYFVVTAVLVLIAGLSDTGSSFDEDVSELDKGTESTVEAVAMDLEDFPVATVDVMEAGVVFDEKIVEPTTEIELLADTNDGNVPVGGVNASLICAATSPNITSIRFRIASCLRKSCSLQTVPQSPWYE